DRDRDRDRGGRRGPSFNRDRDRDERSSVGAAVHQAIGSSMVPPSFPQQQQPAPESTPHQSNQSQHQVPLQRHPPLHPTERAYDAAVIASSTEVRPYAESVERRLNRLSLSTNLIVLKHESLMPLAMEDLARTGVLYAVLLNRQNEMHQSCTVRIFYGQQPFEHRNMPIDDAQSMLGRHFETVLRDLRELPPPASVAVPTGNERLPAGFVRPTPRLMHLLHLLADHRMLSGRELDELAEFISDRRERLAAASASSVQDKSYSSHHQSGAPVSVASNQSIGQLPQNPPQHHQQQPAQHPPIMMQQHNRPNPNIPPHQSQQPQHPQHLQHLQQAQQPQHHQQPNQPLPPQHPQQPQHPHQPHHQAPQRTPEQQKQPAAPAAAAASILQQQADLQAKILSLLNPAAAGAAGQQPQPHQSKQQPPQPNIGQIQKALDSLFGGSGGGGSGAGAGGGGGGGGPSLPPLPTLPAQQQPQPQPQSRQPSGADPRLARYGGFPRGGGSGGHENW
uniref:Nuclear receptor coactivator 5 n=2 Tax=Macrostomum lignano TaxID=282301 RepID=A0A1I8HMC3_9PLAT